MATIVCLWLDDKELANSINALQKWKTADYRRRRQDAAELPKHLISRVPLIKSQVTHWKIGKSVFVPVVF